MNAYFSISELLASCSSTERQKLVESTSLSRNLVLLIHALEGIRSILGEPIMVNSSYRDVAHNKAVGGVPSSQHITASAADIRARSLTKLVEAIKSYQSASGTLGQVIVYDTFVHVALSSACMEKTRPFSLTYH